MAEFWSSPGLEPKRQYRWLLSFGQVNDKLPSYICRKVDKPTFNVTESEHTFLNHKFYYPGRVEWQEVSVTIVDPIDLDAANALQKIIQEAGYRIPSDMDATVETWKLMNTWIKSVDFGSLDYTADELVEITLQLRYDYAEQLPGPPR